MTASALTPPRRPNLAEWKFTVIETFDIAPRMRRVVLTADNLDTFEYRPGQALVMQVPLPDGETGRRDYTIRSLDKAAKRLAVDFVLHGNTPAPTWARSAKAGDEIVARGPRGRTVFAPSADWHLLCGDETCIPAILHILEDMPAGARAFAFIEVSGSEDEQELSTRADAKIEWIHRPGGDAGPSSIMLDRIAGFEFPEGNGHAYLIGETSNVRSQRHHLIERGFTRDRISSEGYWRPGRIGGHDHVED
ncbi:iron-chelator utilization protein [Nitratireductor indicus C115]|uniref:Iron-chelator utilization protein n=1 Tax=Nitratireductor indicus C115 TaxID=1231190 RepID=K2N6T9_9HYPH|nr:siderophore-interacting protein [Nitratireductor indicus]EKF43193.1 iron-chelator utilization protein [Nitratireductor indicus C115]SFQ53572.1 NADPH-dependent ferric siderophore reductase, contains FAD-binding and SIP domains [Nitratireductor indicus]